MRNRFLTLLIFSYACNAVTEVPYPDLAYAWSGAPTPSSIVIKFKTPGEAKAKIILFDERYNDTIGVSEEIKTKKNFYYTGWGSFDSLKANTAYNYEVVVEGMARSKGKFRTLPDKPSSFSFAFGSCAVTGSDSRVFKTINELDPLFYMNIGDFHYENISTNCEYNFARAYFTNLSSHYQRELYQARPFIYMWDDHDFGPNNSFSQSECRVEAIEAYQHLIPHYPLPFEGNKDPISQSFVVGRVKFVLTDLRSQKVRPEYKGCERISEGTNFGPEEHLDWFFKELLNARDSNQVVAWVNPIPWISDERSPKYECDENDDWGGYEEERTKIANFIRDNQIQLFMLSGDAHMLGIDDGTNSDYAEGGGAPIPIFHAAPLDQVGIFKGGPYSHGVSRKRGQFGLVSIEDTGGPEICVTFKGMGVSGRLATNVAGQPLRHSFCFIL